MLLEIITASDSQGNKDHALLQFAIDVADLLYKKTEDTIALINKFQAIRRQRGLTNDEIAVLVNLRDKEGQMDDIKCAVLIILGEAEKAVELLTELPEDARSRIKAFPIYKLITGI